MANVLNYFMALELSSEEVWIVSYPNIVKITANFADILNGCVVKISDAGDQGPGA